MQSNRNQELETGLLGGRTVGVRQPGAGAAARLVPVGVAQQVGAVQLVPQARQDGCHRGRAVARLHAVLYGNFTHSDEEPCLASRLGALLVAVSKSRNPG